MSQLGTGLATPRRRKENIRIHGSPPFAFKNAQLTAGSEEVFDIRERSTAAAKYLSFTSIEIINDDTSNNIEFYPNDGSDSVETIPKGTIKILDPYEIGILSFRLKNTGATTIAANKIIVTLQRKRMDSDKAAFEAAQSSFKGFNLFGFRFGM